MSSLFLSPNDQEILYERFNDVVQYAKNNFEFYKNYYESINESKIESLHEITRFPTIDKSVPNINVLINEVLSKNPPAYFETSGTSGNPFPVIPDLSTKRSKEFADFIYEWLSLDKSEVKRAVIALPFEMNPMGLKYMAALSQLGIMSIPAGVKTHLCPPKKIIELFDRLKPELLIARPLETLRYAEAMIEQGIDLKTCSIKKIILTGEIISKAKFERISKLYNGASVHGVYGLSELDSGGLVSCSHYQYHLPSKPYVLIELLQDDFKSPVTSNGAIGNIVFTNTNKTHMPLLRYKTGDFGTLQQSCTCSDYKTPVINVLGRYSDAIQNKKNDNLIFPIQIEQHLFQYNELVSDYQIVSINGQIELRVELAQVLDLDKVVTIKELIKSDLLKNLGLELREVHIFNPGKLANKLGIAKTKAGTLYVLDNLNEQEQKEQLKLNFCCERGIV